MKKVLLPLLILIACSLLFAVESAPSSIVGYVKYPCSVGSNMIALPMDSGYTMASDMAMQYPGMMDALNSWDAASQSWISAIDLGGFYDGDFEVAPGAVLMVNSISSFNLYSMGVLPTTDASYNIEVGTNAIMVPLNHSEFTMAGDVGLSIGCVDALNAWDATTQSWVSAIDLGGFYDGDYSVGIGFPMFVNSYGTATWPAARNAQSVRAQSASK